jgi:hypothetical protein
VFEGDQHHQPSNITAHNHVPRLTAHQHFSNSETPWTSNRAVPMGIAIFMGHRGGAQGLASETSLR